MNQPYESPRGGQRLIHMVSSWKREGNRCYLHAEGTILEVAIVASNMVRFRYGLEGRLGSEFSYASQAEMPTDQVTVPYDFQEIEDRIHIFTSELELRITKTLHISIFDLEGNLLNEDEVGFRYEPHHEYGGYIVSCSKKIQEQEEFYGLGDKACRSHLRGLRCEIWGSDTYGYEKNTDPLYKNIPFFYGLHGKRAYGIFFDNSFRTRFDFGHDRSDVCRFWAKGGEMNYYFIYGPSLIRVAEGYTDITGRPELPPMWSLGYHQSKWSYFPEERVKKLAKEFRARKIPCDAIHLDIDYMDGYRCFTWNREYFPDPKRFVAEMASEGIKTVLIIDPGLKIDPNYQLYREGIEQDLFCKRADGPYMRGKVWPGDCHFPDFTNPRVRKWWADLFRQFMQSGVHGIWNDMNEPAVLEVGTFPNDTRHDYDGHPCSHRKAHNVYGMQMARASFEGVKAAIYPRRPFLLSRSGYAGLQRYAAVWTGDNLATWEHLWMANIQCQRLSISGLSFCGSDVGGFIGECNPELFVRWMQLGAFHPFYRVHSSRDYGDREPWSFGEPYTSAARQAIETRYRFLPYLYTIFWRYHRYGTPMLLPLTFMDQEDPEVYGRMEEFGLGRSLVVCPIHQAGVEGRQMYLPKGTWYSYWTDAPQEGGVEFWAEASLHTWPIFVRAGATIPHYPVMQHLDQSEIEVVDLHVYFGEGPYTSETYEDAGEYHDYEQGNSLVRTFTIQGDEEMLRIEQRRHGRYITPYYEFRLVIHGLPFVPGEIQIDGNGRSAYKTELEGRPVWTFVVNDEFSSIRIPASRRTLKAAMGTN